MIFIYDGKEQEAHSLNFPNLKKTIEEILEFSVFDDFVFSLLAYPAEINLINPKLNTHLDTTNDFVEQYWSYFWQGNKQILTEIWEIYEKNGNCSGALRYNKMEHKSKTVYMTTNSQELSLYLLYLYDNGKSYKMNSSYFLNVRQGLNAKYVVCETNALRLLCETYIHNYPVLVAPFSPHDISQLLFMGGDTKKSMNYKTLIEVDQRRKK